MSVSVETNILGLLAKSKGPLSLADIDSKLRKTGASKSTLYRKLQNMVAEKKITKKDKLYALSKREDESVVMANDLSRISKMTPLFTDARKGFQITIYSNKGSSKQPSWEHIINTAQSMVESILIKEDTTLGNILNTMEVSRENVKKIVGKKISIVVNFDGTDLIALTPVEIEEKRRKALTLLAKKGKILADNLRYELGVTKLQFVQIIAPLISAGLAEQDENGNISLLFELKEVK